MQRKFIVNLTISCVLCATAWAQNPAPGTTPGPARSGAEQAAPNTLTTQAAANPASVGPDQSVITLKGGCQPIGNLVPAKDCVTSVTRAQFEMLVNSLQPDMPADAKRSFATNYGKLLVFYDAARALHVEDNPNVQQLLAFVGKQVLADGVKRQYADRLSHISDEQIQAYYKQNSAKFLEANLDRIVIPRKLTPDGKADAPDTSSAAAEKIRQRWMAGEDPSKLQQEAYEAIGVNGAGSPNINLGTRRPGSLPVSQEGVFELKAGEVSPVFEDQAAFYLYKLVSIREIPVSEVKDSITKTLQQQLLQDKLEEISRSATPELNEAYFGPAPTSPSPAPRTTTRPSPVPPAPNAPPK